MTKREFFLHHGERYFMEECFRCKTPFAMSEALYAIAQERREEFAFYCPNGHAQHYVRGESEINKLRRERDRLKQQIAYEQDCARLAKDEAEHQRRVAAAQKGQVTRLKKRAKAGVCPCCNRTFKDLARHMATKHPEMDPAADDVVVPLRA